MSFKDRVAKARKEKGWSQGELARRAGINREVISQWELGESKNVSSQKLFAVARALDVSAEWLFDGKGPMRPYSKLDSGGEKILDIYYSLPNGDKDLYLKVGISMLGSGKGKEKKETEEVEN